MRSGKSELPQPPRNDRPDDLWICGHTAAGCPCPHGPSPAGQCQGLLGGCQPTVSGNRLKCNRPACLGGPCDLGPTTDGACGLSKTPCRPRRSTGAKWRRAMRLTTVGCLLILGGLVLSPSSVEFLAPGKLSEGHRQILGTTLATQRCASCHPGASGSLAQWFLSASSGHENVKQSDLCLSCHHATIPPETSRLAHNLSQVQLTAIADSSARTSGGRQPWLPQLDSETLECAACHREHHGDSKDLRAMTETQCQVCHKQQFTSFESGHPDWKSWPYGKGGEIRFDHRSHQHRHHPSKQANWNCRDCHRQTEQGEIVRSVDYQTACAACHDQPLKQQMSEGFALFQVPSIDVSALQKPGLVVPDWPEEAKGFTDLSLPPVMRLLLVALDADEAGIESTATSAPDQIATSSAATASDAEQTVALMQSIRTLAEEVRSEGASAIKARLSKLSSNSSRYQPLTDFFPVQILDHTPWWPGAAVRQVQRQPAAIQRMAFQTDGDDLLPPDNDADALLTPVEDRIDLGADSLAPTDDGLGLGDPLEANDPLASPFALPSRPKKTGGVATTGTGWFRDDRTFAVRYRPEGHGDVRMQALIELALECRETKFGEACEAVLGMPSVKACLECHRPQEVGQQWHWHASKIEQRPKGFTKFSHRPHLHQPLLSNCSHCHRVGEDAGKSGSISALVSQNLHDFKPMPRSACVDCHRSDAAATTCTQCHRYHVEWP